MKYSDIFRFWETKGKSDTSESMLSTYFQWVIAVPPNLRSRNLTLAQRHHMKGALHTGI